MTKERQLFILRGTVQRQKLEEDIDRIVGLYQDHGYVQMRVERYDTSVNRETARVTITIEIVEGAQYRVGTIKLTGLNLFPEAEVRRQLRFKTGDVFSRSELRDTVRGITDLYSTIGHASAEVMPRTDQQPATLTMDVTIEVTEGPEVYVERINISGNTRSEDRILRREIPFVEGDLFTLQKLQRARQRLVNLGLLRECQRRDAARHRQDAYHRERGGHRARRPASSRIGGGYSSVDSFVGTLDISQNNFLGRGWQVALRIRAGGTRPAGDHQLHRALAVRPAARRPASICSASSATTTTTTTTSLGGNVRMSHPFQEYWRWRRGPTG